MHDRSTYIYIYINKASISHKTS